MLPVSQPHLRKVKYLCSDNAGYYNCTNLLAFLLKLMNKSFVTIKEYNLSEEQSRFV